MEVWCNPSCSTCRSAREHGLEDMARDDETLTEVLAAGRRPADDA